MTIRSNETDEFVRERQSFTVILRYSSFSEPTRAVLPPDRQRKDAERNVQEYAQSDACCQKQVQEEDFQRKWQTPPRRSQSSLLCKRQPRRVALVERPGKEVPLCNVHRPVMILTITRKISCHIGKLFAEVRPKAHRIATSFLAHTFDRPVRDDHSQQEGAVSLVALSCRSTDTLFLREGGRESCEARFVDRLLCPGHPFCRKGTPQRRASHLAP